MRSDDPMRHSGARWCDQHGKWECARRRKGGGECHGSAIRGLDRCRMHAGERLDLAKAKGEAAVTAWSARGTASVSATDAVLGMLHMSWLRVHLYASLLEQQVDDARGDGDGTGRTGVGRGAGLVGHTYSGVKDIGIFATGEAVRALAQLEATERDRCVRFAKVAHDMGIAEQQIRIAEQQGAILADAINEILGALELSAQQRARVPEVVPQVLRAITAGDAA